MGRTKKLSDFEELVKRLEVERNDISYRKPLAKPQEVIKVIEKVVDIVPERLKKIYFHAGRYSAGDRDSLAIEAFVEFEKLER